MPRSSSDASSSAGFTLIELLAAMAVLAVLVVGVTGIINAVANNTTTSNDSAAAAARARTVLDRIDHDLLLRLGRGDVPAAKGSGGKADSPGTSAPVAFSVVSEVPSAPPVTEASGVPANPTPAAVHYRLVADAPLGDEARPMPALQRASVALLSKDFKAFPAMKTAVGLDDKGEVPVLPAATPEDFVTLAAGVLAMSIGSLQPDGSFATSAMPDLSRVSVLVVAVAVVDDTALARSTPEQVRALAGALQMPSTGTRLPLEQWTTAWRSGPSGGVPDFLWNSVRFYQRLIPLS